MAKIEMDISEYEEMKKNTKLLEKALKREEKLGEKIDKLNQEKIQAFEDNKNMVTIVEHSSKTETVYVMESPEKIVRRILELVERSRHSGNSMRGIGGYHDMRDTSMSFIIHEVGRFQDLFFKKDVIETPGQKIVSRKGFDEVKTEVRNEYLAQLSESDKSKLSEFLTLQKDLAKEKSNSFDINRNLEKANVTISELGEELGLIKKDGLELERLQDSVKIFVKFLKKEVDKDISIFNYNTYKKEISNHLNKWQTDEDRNSNKN